jgi:ATP-dependent RNA helicase HelY
VQRNVETIQSYANDEACHHGDFDEYFAIRIAIADRERANARQGVAQRRAAIVTSLERLRMGDVIRVAQGRRAGLAVVLEAPSGGFGEPRPMVLTQDRWAGRVSPADFAGEAEVLDRIRVPKHFNPRSPAARRDLAAQVSATGHDRNGNSRRRSRGGTGEDPEIALLKVQMRQHPCHACPEREDHARWAERRHRLQRDTDALRDKVAGRTGSLARTFDQVCAVLGERGYLTEAGEVTETGRMLGRIWSEADLLVAECLRHGVWDDLAPEELAAAVSMVLYESRRETDDRASVPKGAITTAVDACGKLWGDIAGDESDHGLSLTREPDPGFVWPMYRWARGEPLAKVLASGHNYDADMPAGDFVRWARQVLDLLGQLREASAASQQLRDTARKAITAINRGVLAYHAGL